MRRVRSVFLVLFFSCSLGTGGDIEPPAPPVLLTPEEPGLEERYTGPVPDGNWMRLAWVVGDEDDLARYDIYRRAEGEFVARRVGALEVIWAPGDTAVWDDRGVELKVRYRYFLRAVDRVGNESLPSDTVDYRLLPKFIPQSPSGDIGEHRPLFLFGSPGDPDVAYFRIVVEEMDGRRIWVSIWQDATALFVKGVGRIRYNFDGEALWDSLRSGEYRWRVDTMGAEPRTGSKSRWMVFHVL